MVVLQGGNNKGMHKAMLRLKINPNKDLTSIHSETQTNPIRASMLNFMAKMCTSTLACHSTKHCMVQINKSLSQKRSSASLAKVLRNR